MYIVNSGIVQVMGGPDGTKVLATLHPGSVFGEISLLAMGGGNRRTADVISPGFANLFVLNKQDLQEAIVNYPEAQESLKRKAKEIMKQNDANKTDKKKKRGKSLIAESILTKRRENTPRMFDAVLQVARSSRLSHSILKGAAKRKDSEFAEYSYHSSTDSEASFNEYDEQSIISERSVTRYRRKKRSPNKKKSEKCSGHENKPSSFDSAVIVHSSPKSDTEAEVESIVSSATRKRSKKSASGKKKKSQCSLDDLDCDSLLNDNKAEIVNEEKPKLRKKKSRDSVQNAISDIMKNTADSDSIEQLLEPRSASAALDRKFQDTVQGTPEQRLKSASKSKQEKDADLDGLSDILNDNYLFDKSKEDTALLPKAAKKPSSPDKTDKPKAPSAGGSASDGRVVMEKMPQKLPPLKSSQGVKNLPSVTASKPKQTSAKKKSSATPPARKVSSRADSTITPPARKVSSRAESTAITPPARKMSSRTEFAATKNKETTAKEGQKTTQSGKKTPQSAAKQPLSRKSSVIGQSAGRKTSHTAKPTGKETTQKLQPSQQQQQQGGQQVTNKNDESQPKSPTSTPETKQDNKNEENEEK
ncbi:uncharacterized protein [Ptychodera flava]|uniref:uncharacterized protein n=2 Tax=Ptychodera flava TaxID=63121 RepID=UPI00396A0E10